MEAASSLPCVVTNQLKNMIKTDKETGLPVGHKRANENVLFDMPMANRMRDGDTIDSFVATFPKFVNLGKVQDSSDITIESFGYSGTTAQIRISGGQDGEHYKVTVAVNTSLGDVIEFDGILYIGDE